MSLIRVIAVFVGSAYFLMGIAMFLAPRRFYKIMGYSWEMNPALESQTSFAGLWHFGYSVPLIAAGALGKIDTIQHLMVFGGYPLSLCILYQQWNMVTRLKGMPPENLKKLRLIPITVMALYTLALFSSVA